jgi:aryl-alcohol dehydrogenase-like predicted oxidoreductase
VRYIGVSNFAAWQLQKAIDLSKMHGWEPFVCLQPLYNLLDREVEWELAPVCLNEGVGIIPWSPLRGGWLSGKYQRGMKAALEGTRVEEASKNNWGESWEKYNNDRTWRVLDALHVAAIRTGKKPAQVALRWLLQKPGVTAPIIGVRTMDHLETNLGAAGWALSSEEMQALDTASEKDAPYPVELVRNPRT